MLLPTTNFMKLTGKLYLLSLLVMVQTLLFGQAPDVLGRMEIRTITTAVPFLLISPDPIASAMGESGVATANDVYSLYWNPAKYAATSQLQSTDPSQDFRVGLSYSPWLRRMVDGIWEGSFYGSKLLSQNSAISTSFRYFTLGELTFTTIQGNVIGTSTPVEWALDVAYSQRLSNHWFGGVALRTIYSDLTNGHNIESKETKTGVSIAADLSAYYETHLGENNNTLTFGACIANIGNKISYTKDNENKEFIPTILRIGPSFNWNIAQNHQLRFSFELDKLLVPSPPVYAFDSITGEIVLDDNDQPVILEGRSSDVSVMGGMIRSFYDAPDGFSEELHEITKSFGLEYRLYNIVSLRGGYFSEHETKGSRKYFTAGIGVKYKFIEANIAKIIDTEKGYKFNEVFKSYKDQKHIGFLHRTMRYSIAFDLAGIYKLRERKMNIEE